MQWLGLASDEIFKNNRWVFRERATNDDERAKKDSSKI